MIYQLTTYGGAGVTTDVTCRINKNCVLYCVDFSGVFAFDAASLGAVVFTSQLWKGSAITRYGDGAAYPDTQLLAQNFGYLIQKTINGNFRGDSNKTIPGLKIFLPAQTLLTLRSIVPAASSMTMDVLLYTT